MLPALAQERDHQPQPAMAEQLFALANQTRSRMGRGSLEWDQSLADAAMKHCQRMAVEGPLSHRYNGELDLTARAAQAGAHFSLIEENIAIGPYPATIHQEWMNSQGHRENLLNPDIDRIGVAVISARGVLYAVADYSKGVVQKNQAQVESTIGSMIRARGVALVSDPRLARAACAADHGAPRGPNGEEPGFVMRWQDSDLSHLPSALEQRLSSGQYRRAAVGSCEAHNTEGAFTTYRLAVLLY